MSETIVALATPPFKSALAIIRMSGPSSFEYIKKCFSKPQSIDGSRKMVFGEVLNEKETIDQVMLFLYPANASMTGENVVEISCHGSLLIIKEIISVLLGLGARYAKNGEFTERAFLSGKMDLIQCEAVNELIDATSLEGKKLALLSLKGEASSLLYPLKEKLSDILSLIEVNIDYPEYEDIEVMTNQRIVEECRKMRKEISLLIKGGEQGRIIKEGVKIAIVGEPNVGKSSLLNALIDEDKAIVTSIPGTTRDLVEGTFYLDGVLFIVLDTAGIRETSDEVEKIGVERSKKAIEEADIVVLVEDASEPKIPSDIAHQINGKRVIEALNKTDLLKANKKKNVGIYVSALNKDIGSLKAALIKEVGLDPSAFRSSSLSNARQLGILRQTDELLANAVKEAEEGVSNDLISVSIHKALNQIKELLGEEPSQDLTKEIFARFCIGK